MDKKPKFPIIPAAALGVLMLLGFSLLLWPGLLVEVLPVLIGVLLLLAGVLVIASGGSLRQLGIDTSFRTMFGAVTIVVALVFLVKQDISLVFLSVLFGLYVLITAALSVVEIVNAVRSRQPFILPLLSVVVQMALGLLLLFAPFAGLSLWVQILGVHFVLAGVNGMFWLVRLWRAFFK